MRSGCGRARTVLRQSSTCWDRNVRVERGSGMVRVHHVSQGSSSARRLSIAFAFVATHNHFVLDRGGKVFKQSAPIIKLPADATEEDHLGLLGMLNSSTACFWMKQVFMQRGARWTTEHRTSELRRGSQRRLTATQLRRFPIPDRMPNGHWRRRLDSLGQTNCDDHLPASAVARARRLAEARSA